METIVETTKAVGRRKPPLIISTADYERIAGLANALLDANPAVAEELLDEIERATVLPASEIPAEVVGMHSAVTFRDDKRGTEQRFRLVYPNEADIGEGRVSVLTPIGAALIGLSKGQSIAWRARDGEERMLTVLDVEPPEAGTADS